MRYSWKDKDIKIVLFPEELQNVMRVLIDCLINFNELINIAFLILICSFAANFFHSVHSLVFAAVTWLLNTFYYEGTPEFRLRWAI